MCCLSGSFLFVTARVPPAGLRKENGKMKIKYEFVNGETSEIEVDDSLGELLVDFDRQQYNNDHKETRRHVSLFKVNAAFGLSIALMIPLYHLVQEDNQR